MGTCITKKKPQITIGEQVSFDTIEKDVMEDMESRISHYKVSSFNSGYNRKIGFNCGYNKRIEHEVK